MRMGKETALLGGTALAGVVGFGLRWWDLSASFEPDTGLPIPGAPASLALAAWSLAVAAVLLAVSLRERRAGRGDRGRTFACRGEKAPAAVLVLAAFLSMTAGSILLCTLGTTWEEAMAEAYRLQTMDPEQWARVLVVPQGVAGGLAVVSGVGMLALGRGAWSGEAPRRGWALLPPYTACMWLVCAYQRSAGDPVRQNYIYELLALIAVLLGSYYAAGIFFKNGKGWALLFSTLMGTYLCLVTLADRHSLARLLFFVAMAGYLACHAYLQLRTGGGEDPAADHGGESGEGKERARGTAGDPPEPCPAAEDGREARGCPETENEKTTPETEAEIQ